MKVTATLKLHIDIDQAREMGMEIDDPQEYAIDEFIDWVFEMTKSNDLAECIHVELEEADNE
jgi:hypothetical protein